MSVRRLSEEYDIDNQSNEVADPTVPEYLSRIATAIKSEQGAIQEYDALLDTYDLPQDLIDTIKEIQNDEKDHMILLSAAMERFGEADFPENTDELSELPYPTEEDIIEVQDEEDY